MKKIVTTSISLLLLVSLMFTQAAAQFKMGNQFLAEKTSITFNPNFKLTASVAERLPSEVFYAEYLNPADSELRRLEEIVAAVSERKIITDEEGEQIDSTVSRYAELIFNASNKADEQARLASETQGEQGNADLVGDFETVAVDHERRTEVIADKIARLFEEARNYTVKLERQALERLSAAELKEFEDFLTPKGRARLRKENPDLFETRPAKKNGSVSNQSASLRAVSFNPNENQPTAPLSTCRYEEPAEFTNFLSTKNSVGSLTFGSAPQIWKPCVRPCKEKKWLECATCVVRASSETQAAYQELQSCLSNIGPCKWYKPWNCIKRAICLAKFVYKLA